MYNKDSETFIHELNIFSGNKIKNPDDLKLLYTTSLSGNKLEEFEKTVFTAKYVNGLKRVLKTGSGNPEIKNIDQIRKDLTVNYENAVNQIKDLIVNEEAESVSRFKKKYFLLDEESFINLNSLLDDLEWTKMFLNEHKKD